MEGGNVATTLVKTRAGPLDQTAGTSEGCVHTKEEGSNVFRVLGGNTTQTLEEENHAHFTVETNRSQAQIQGNADQTLVRFEDTGTSRPQVHYHLHQTVTKTVIENPSTVAIGENVVANQGVAQETESDVEKPPSNVKILRDATLKTIQEWIEGMVQTRAVTTLVERLSVAPPVFVVKGRPGEGKTTVAMMALKRLYDMGRNVFIIKTPEEYMTVKSLGNSIILLNDVFGSSHFHVSNLSIWEKVLDDQLALTEHTGERERSKSTLLLVSRTSVLDSASEYFGRYHSIILRKDGVMDMTEDMVYTDYEKMQIWSYHSQRENVKVDEGKVRSVCDTRLIHGFPHCCRLFSGMFSCNPDLDMYFFFTHPLELLQQEMKSMFDDDVAGQMLRDMLRNGGVYSRDISDSSENSYKIKQIIARGEGTYFKQENARITFHHPSIYDAVAFIACEKDPSFVIDCCSMSFLNDRVRLKGLSGFNKEEQTTVNIDERFRIDLMKRMKTEVVAGNISLVLSHPSFHDCDFVNQFMDELLSSKSDPDGVRRLIQQRDKLTNESFLLLAPKSKSSKILQYICEKVTLSTEEQKDLLFSICRYRSTSSLHYFLKEYPKCDHLSVKDARGDSLLIAAAHSRCGDILILLMNKGVTLQDKDQLGCTALYYICILGVDNAATVVEMMLKNGADIFDICNFDTTPLVLACHYGNTSVVEALLKDERVAKLIDKEGNILSYYNWVQTPLHAAAQKGFEIIVDILLNKGVNINKCDKKGITPLHSACLTRSDNVARTLLRKGADIHITDDRGWTPLYVACCSGSDTIVNILLRLGAEKHVNKRDIRDGTLLHAACLSGSDSVVKTILSKGGEMHVNTCNKLGRTPLHNACMVGSDAVVTTLLSKGAKVVTCDSKGRASLHFACKQGSETAVKTLLGNGAEIYVNKCDSDGLTPLHDACQGGSDIVVEMLLRKGANINTCDGSGRTPLHDACMKGSETVVKTLLSKGAEINLNTCDGTGKTPLHDACIGGSETVVRTLLNKGAELNKRDKSGRTSLHDACTRRESVTIVTSLISKGAEIDRCDESGRTPLHEACRRQEDDSLVRILLSKGAEINKCDVRGWTPLHDVCIGRGSATVMRTLLSKGAGINTCDRSGRTPLDYARRFRKKCIVATLLERGAVNGTSNRPDSAPSDVMQ